MDYRLERRYMNLTFEAGIPVFTVFIQGVLSFLSPCVFPLVPLYIGYLAGGTLNVDEQGRMVYPKKKVFLHTVCFVFGIGFIIYRWLRLFMFVNLLSDRARHSICTSL